MAITFINGFTACGKSTAALRMAIEQNCDFIDLDACIEARFELSIPQIFAQKGEESFRIMERDCLRSIIANYSTKARDLVIACGGGTPCFFDNLELMKSSGHCIFLPTPSIEELCRRILAHPAQRPLLQGIAEGELPHKLEEMLKKRENCYK